MKDEINIKMPGQILDYVDTKEHLLELFNYITNLQEENQRLKEEKSLIESDINNAYSWLEDYKSRNEKAIEYINNKWKKDKYYEDIENCMTFCLYDKDNLLNILEKGE